MGSAPGPCKRQEQRSAGAQGPWRRMRGVRRQKQGPWHHPGAWGHVTLLERGRGVPAKNGRRSRALGKRQEWRSAGAQGPRDVSGARMEGVLTSRARPRPSIPSPIHPRSRCAVFGAVVVHPGVSAASSGVSGCADGGGGAQSDGGGMRVAAATVVAA